MTRKEPRQSMDDDKKRMVTRQVLVEVLVLLVLAVSIVALQRRATSRAPTSEQLIASVTEYRDARTQVTAVYALLCRRRARLEGAQSALDEATQVLGPAALAFMRSWAPGYLPQGSRRVRGDRTPDARD